MFSNVKSFCAFLFLLPAVLGVSGFCGTPVQLNVYSVPGGAICDGYHRVGLVADILDSSWDVVEDADNTVTFSISSGGGTFESSTVVDAKGGKAYINLISPTSPGTTMVSCSSPGLGSDSVNVEWVEPRMAFDKFPIGIYEDVGPTWHYNFGDAIDDMRAHNIDSCMMGNGKVGRDEGVLDAAESKNFDMYMGIMGTVGESGTTPDFYADSTPTLAEARVQRDEILNNWGGYDCVQAWYSADEPGTGLFTHVSLITDAFQEADSFRPATPVLIGTDRVGPHFSQSELDVLCIDMYPAGYFNDIGDFTMGHWGYSHLDMVSYIRYVSIDRPAGVPMWIVLQTHNFQTQLRQPEPEEVRCMHWLALAENATGYFWFIYSEVGSNSWTGLKNQSANYAEVSSLAGRLKANGNELRDILVDCQRVPDLVDVSGPTVPDYIQPHATTLMKTDGSEYYSVVVNHDCESSRTLTVDSAHFVQATDVETDVTYNLPFSLSFEAGDGKVFALTAEAVPDPDLNDDGPVDVDDLRTMAGNWLDSVGPEQGDIDFSGKVDIQDFRYIADGWTGPDTEAPSVPTGLVVDERTDDSISFGWDPSSDNYVVEGYYVYKDGDWVNYFDMTTGASYTDTGLSSPSSHTYKVSAFDGAGNESGLSDMLTASTVEYYNSVIDPSIEEGIVPWGTEGTWEGPKYEGAWGSGLWDTNSANARSGIASYKGTGEPGWGYAYIDQDFDIDPAGGPGKLKPSTNYMARCYVNIPNTLSGTGVKIRVVRFFEGGGYDVINMPSVTSATTGYEQVSLDFNTSSNTDAIRIDLLWEISNTESVWFDDVSIVEN